eukprot:1350139-Amorphochlora_amoeboformis.AAC.2
MDTGVLGGRTCLNLGGVRLGEEVYDLADVAVFDHRRKEPLGKLFVDSDLVALRAGAKALVGGP